MWCPLLNVTLISHQVKESTSSVIHQQMTEGGMQDRLVHKGEEKEQWRRQKKKMRGWMSGQREEGEKMEERWGGGDDGWLNGGKAKMI